MATGFVQVPPDSTGKRVDCVSLSAGGQTVVRQTVVIADPTKSAGFAIVSGGQQLVKGAFTLSNNVNVSAMPAVVVTSITNAINISAMPKVTLSGTNTVVIGAGAANIGTINNISAGVVLAAGAANIGTINGISANVNVVVTNQVQISNISATVNVAGTFTIGTIDKISATVTVAGSIVLAAGTANFGTINNISATVNVAGTFTIGTIDKISATVTVAGIVALAAGAANIGTINNISAAVVLAAGANNIGTINNISANVTVVNAAGTANIGAVSLAAGTAKIGFIGKISAGVVLAAGAANIGSINNISAAVVLAAGANNIGTLNGISATVIAAMVRVKLSASAAIADNTVGMSWGDKFGRQVIINNHPSLLPSASHGPKTVTISTSASVALIAAPGAGLCAYVTGLTVTNGSATLTRADCYVASATAGPDVAQYLAASGGGFAMKFDPPWQISANSVLNARVKPNVSQALFTIHFYVGPA